MGWRQTLEFGLLRRALKAAIYLHTLKYQALAALRFWQVMRRSREHGFQASLAAASHLMLTRALKDGRVTEIPTYDDDQTRLGSFVARPTPGAG